ncbi:nitroreductase [Nitrosospira sp. NpAV]|nr:nitroreductase [Nitrosospira sp. NpAV]
MEAGTKRWQALLEYHERSKHHVYRYAPGPGVLDWVNQPNPFREFSGAPQIKLSLTADTLGTQYNDIRCGKLPLPAHFNVNNLATLFELSLGLSAWKSYNGNRWALRCNPSSGNLHPTEGYLLCPPLEGLPAGVYHYLSRNHVLEQRTAIGDPQWAEAFAGRGILIGLTSIHWREAWKYGMRAWRYCQHDCGHAIAAVSYAAAALGWQTRLVLSAGDDETAGLLGLNRNEGMEPAASAELEAADALLWVGDPDTRPDLGRLLQALENRDRAEWRGRANLLSKAHVPWPDIDSIHHATYKPHTLYPREMHELAQTYPARIPPHASSAAGMSFSRIARQRRSAISFDGITHIPAPTFFSMLECLIADHSAPPWNSLGSSQTMVHPVFLVHRITGLKPGLYIFLRNPAILQDMKRAMRADWLWQKTGPDHLPLYLLLAHDLRDAAKLICCHQGIAADSCFALGMLAQFSIIENEPWRYRHLFWECGMLGQMLYLEAEAAGIRATGIGCFFDDEMHALLGINDHSWQSLYHFTMGGPTEDSRLLTLPPYGAGT